MGTKALLSNINSVWGTIINPQSSNTYRHILSFDTPELKKAFIDKELFEGNDHLALLEKQPEIALTQTTGNLATFSVNPVDYPNETIDSLLKKDFAIISENGETRYYTLVSNRKGQMIVYIADLDIFFNDDIKDMFNDKPTRISRAMIDRYKINGDTLEVQYKNNKLHENEIYNTEPIDQNIKESLIPSEKYSLSNSNIWDDLMDKTMTDAQKEYTRLQMSKMQIPFLATQVSENRESKLLKSQGDHLAFWDTFSVRSVDGISTEQPYSIVMGNNSDVYICIQDGSTGDFKPHNRSILVDESDPNTKEYRFIKRWDMSELADASIVKTSYSISPQNVYEMLYNYIKQIDPNNINNYIGLTRGKGEFGDNEVTFLNINSILLNKFGSPIVFKESLKSINKVVPSYRAILQYIDHNNIEEHKVVSEIFKDVKLTDLKIENKIDHHKYEVKTLVAPYTKYMMKSSSKFSLDIYPQFFTTNEISGKYGFGFLTEQWTQWFKLNNYYNNIYNSANDIPMELDYSYEDANNYSFATDINAWEEFITSNKAQQNASFLNKGISAGVGAIGAIATGGFSALALGSIALKSAGELNSQFAQRKDIRNTPNKLVNAGSILLQDLVNKNIKPFLYKYELNTLDKILVNEFFYKYGYNFNNKLKPIKPLLKSRFYFNYIEIPETFEQIILQSSAEIKQLINDTLANGVTIWHIRDLNQFKGVKNYEYENVEMSIYNALKGGNNAKGKA